MKTTKEKKLEIALLTEKLQRISGKKVVLREDRIIRPEIDKVKNFKQFVNEQKLNEISSELRNNTISSMKDKGMDKRAEKWTQFYVDKDLNDFKNKEIFDDKLIIYGFRLNDKDNTLNISYGSPRNQEYNKNMVR